MDSCLADDLKLDYLNGLLAEKEKAALEEHLAACPACRREVDALRKTAAAVAGLTPPSVPAAWTAAAKDRLRAKRLSVPSPVRRRPIPVHRGTNVFQYALAAAGVTAGLAVLIWLVMGGPVQRWLPGLSAAGFGIANPRVARAVDLGASALSLHALLLVPLIIDNIYRLARREGRKAKILDPSA